MKQRDEKIKKEKESDNPKTAVSELSDSCFTDSLCSAQEYTGLIPSPPLTDAELESYEEMVPFLVPPLTDKHEHES
ncbi:MAG: hypothetical protein LUG93_08505 [Lachnospiraceae bacterium]|nr:hypothetical protein [Lachnospiraceae bacterium]